MLRQIIRINRDLCNGCGLCVSACHEGAIGLRDGKAELLRDDYCDGLGACLPVCPTGAITFETRQAAMFDAEAVKARTADEKGEEPAPCPSGSVCPGHQPVKLRTDRVSGDAASVFQTMGSELMNFPVQIRLAAANAPFFKEARLLIAADCAAYAHGDFHRRFMKDRVTLIGCPKLDDPDYADKLTDILRLNDVRSITLVRMDVPCCGGLTHALTTAMRRSGKLIPWQVVTINARGDIVDQ